MYLLRQVSRDAGAVNTSPADALLALAHQRFVAAVTVMATAPSENLCGFAQKALSLPTSPSPNLHRDICAANNMASLESSSSPEHGSSRSIRLLDGQRSLVAEPNKLSL